MHSLIVDETGGSHGIRDYHLLMSAVAQPKQKVFGEELYKTLFEKSAVYARGIIMNHPFVDGNKRTGIASAFIFLEENKFISTAKKGQIEKFAVDIVKKKLVIKDIAVWLKKNSKKIK